MNDILIRQAELSDLDAILTIEEASFSGPWTKESFLSALSSEYVTVFAAEVFGTEVVGTEREARLVGFGCVCTFAPECEIQNIAVHPDARGNGIGERLLSAMLRHGMEKGADTAFLEVRESNTPARTLYEKSGFLSIGIRRNYYSKPTENAVIMQLNMTENSPL